MSRYQVVLGCIIVLFFASNCSKKLDNIQLNDNPYDREYAGSAVINVSSIISDTVSYPTMVNYIYFTKTIDNYDGVRLFRSGTLINTVASSSTSLSGITDNAATSGVTYTYQLRLYLGSGEAESESFTYTTP